MQATGSFSSDDDVQTGPRRAAQLARAWRTLSVPVPVLVRRWIGSGRPAAKPAGRRGRACGRRGAGAGAELGRGRGRGARRRYGRAGTGAIVVVSRSVVPMPAAAMAQARAGLVRIRGRLFARVRRVWAVGLEAGTGSLMTGWCWQVDAQLWCGPHGTQAAASRRASLVAPGASIAGGPSEIRRV